MNPINSKAAYWLKKGIFDDLKSFDDFESRVNVVLEEKDRGDLFEIFIEGYIATQAITQSVKHWVVGNIPLEMRERYNLPSDGTGIDGIYETHDGDHVAYQVKYRQNHNLTFAEVAPFLGITEKFLDRVIFTNATALSHKAVVRTRWYSGDVFNSLSEAQLAQIEAWLKENPVPVVRATPNPSYQVQALADINSTFEKHDRATVVMACGTGKTLVALWATEQAKPKTVLVLLPSLTLLQQTLKEWSEQTSWGSKFSYLCVCSDQTVGLKNDEVNIDKTEVGFRVDTDPAIVRQFLERQSDDVKVIFSTYHSTDVVAQGSQGLEPFDIGIFDEAHKTTGISGGIFSHALSDDNVRINKRLFLTATPRHIDIRKRDKEGEFRVQSMDDETVYGPRAHTLSFGEAANKGIICRYKVIVSLIDKQMVDDFTRKNGITLVDGDAIGARWVANLIALDQAARKVDAKKIITFHSKVALAKEFATNEPRGIAYYLHDYDVRHVNGSQNSGERSELISAFANSEKGVITNARCLTEGVNIPAVDMVAFIDPRQSKVDITQAVGRAMRKPRGATTKTVGYVLVPLFAGMDGEDLEEAIKTEKFDAIADVLNALQEHDEELVDIIRELQQSKGRGEVFNPQRLLERVEFIGPSVGLEELTRSISIAITDRLGATWDQAYGILSKFYDREGHSKVSQRYLEDGYRLGQWVGVQRWNKSKLTDDRLHRLNALDFVWDPHTDQWEEGFRSLVSFHERVGHLKVPNEHLEGDYRLGAWVERQRTTKGKLSEERLNRLNDLGFVWDVLTEQWEEGFSALVKFHEREGHSKVPQVHQEGGYRLGAWVTRQRTTKGKLSEERLNRLNDLGFVWDVLTEQWEEGFSALVKFHEREGHSSVSQTQIEDGYRLGSWVNNQRTRKVELSDEKLGRLNSLDFVWDVLTDNWERMFGALLNFQQRELHVKVPFEHIENSYPLGKWVQLQRANKSDLSEDRSHRLNALGFVWDPYADQWEEGFSALAKFHKREGHSKVTKVHRENGYRLGAWVMRQRSSQSELSVDRISRLNSLGFVWDPHTIQWEEGFSALVKFHQRDGHSKVPKDHLEDGYRLGQWVGVQRRNKSELTEDRLHRLNALDFVWDPHTDQWEEGFRSLVSFHERVGHLKVPNEHLEGDYRLGAWVERQRTTKGKLSEERLNRLNDLGFVWDVLTDQWEEGFRSLVSFHERVGHLKVPNEHLEGDYRLGAWVERQRTTKGKLSEERLNRLNDLGFVWDVLTEQWEEGFSALVKFHEREGHSKVPRDHLEDGYQLGSWVRIQRSSKNKMDTDRSHRLNALGFVWDPYADQWEEGFSALAKFHKREGHSKVPSAHLEDGYRLGTWVSNIRQEKIISSSDQLARLNALGFVWDVLAQKWEDGFSSLVKFNQREGHLKVPYSQLEDGYPLGTWVGIQRTSKAKLSEERLRRLNALGFIWVVSIDQWEEGFSSLLKFKQREGHLKVPDAHLENGYPLGSWVRNQRTRKSGLTEEKLDRLNDIGFVWDALRERWDEGYSVLMKFKHREGHCRVPQKHLEDDYPLGAWVTRQRSNKATLSEERRHRLDELGFIWDARKA